jgi:hypothetical protein
VFKDRDLLRILGPSEKNNKKMIKEKYSEASKTVIFTKYY